MDPAEAARWLRTRRPIENPRVRLVCLPYAGGGETVFHRWCDELPDDIEVRAVQLPGRQNRIREPGLTRVEPIVEALVAALETLEPAPLALYGHSFGTLVAFELARALAEQGANQPVHLVAAARGSPRLAPRRPPIYHLPDPAFLEALHRNYGTALNLLQNAELMELALPSLRADFEALDTYRYAEKPRLTIPITAIAGRRDTVLSADRVAAWRQETSGPYTEHWLDVGHFFVDTHRSLVLARVIECLG